MKKKKSLWFKRSLLGISLLLVGCVTPQPVSVIFMLDGSASFESKRPEAVQTVKDMTFRLDPNRDQIKIFRVGQTVYHLYTGGVRRRELTHIMDEYTTVKPDERGTAYGTALQRGIEEVKRATESVKSVPQHSESASTEGVFDFWIKRIVKAINPDTQQPRKAALVIIGDGEDEIVEGGGNLTDEMITELFKGFPQSALVSFVYIEPENGDRFQRLLTPSLGDRLQLITPIEMKESKAIHPYKHWLEQ